MRKVGTCLTHNYITSRLQGRTGNMMFQLAHGYTKSLKYNRQFVAPYAESSSRPFEQNLFRKIDFFIDKTPTGDKVKIINAPFEYIELEPSHNKPTVFTGWYQSEKYFGDYKEIIRDLFSPTLDFIKKVTIEYPFFLNSIIAAINVRRGDYLTQSTRHPVISLEYINEAYKYLPPHDVLFVMSDDMDWCKENIKLPNVIFNNQSKFWDHEGLWLLSLCDHFIISNSTFSWWGAWLSKTDNKVVIAPDTWFGPDIKENTKDLYCDSWIQIPTIWEDGFLKLK